MITEAQERLVLLHHFQSLVGAVRAKSSLDRTQSEEEQPLIGHNPDQWEESLKDEACQCLGVRNGEEGVHNGPEYHDGGGGGADDRVGEGGGR